MIARKYQFETVFLQHVAFLVIQIIVIYFTYIIDSSDLNFFKLADFNSNGPVRSLTCSGFSIFQTIRIVAYSNFATFGYGLIHVVYDRHNELSKNLFSKRINYCLRYEEKQMIKQTLKIDWDMVQKASYLSYINAFIAYIGAICFVILCQLRPYSQICDSLFFEKQDFGLIIMKIALMFVLGDMILWCNHKILHQSRYLYENIHKLHHRWNNLHYICGGAVHPIEFFFTMLLQVTYLPCVIANIPFGFGLLFFAIGSLFIFIGHNGYDKFLGLYILGGAPHDFHHHLPKCQFSFLFTDKLFKTTIKDVYPKIWQRMQNK